MMFLLVAIFVLAIVFAIFGAIQNSARYASIAVLFLALFSALTYSGFK